MAAEAEVNHANSRRSSAQLARDREVCSLREAMAARRASS